MGDRPTSLSGAFHVGVPRVAPSWGWVGRTGSGPGRVGDAVEQSGPRVVPGPASGRCKVIRRAEDATRAGTWISLRRTVAVVAFAIFGVAVRVAAARVRLNVMTASTPQATVGGELPGGQVRQRGALRGRRGPVR